MAIYQSMTELIGNTPLVRLNHLGFPEDAHVFAKLELWNPGGSVKDRTGLYMLRDAESRGLLQNGGTIIEVTAGNTGIGTAFAALNRGYRVIFVVPDGFSREKQILMKALGAEIVNTSREDGMLGAQKKADELRAAIPGAISLDQFHNRQNPLAHYETTGREIWEDLGESLSYFVAGAGSGGTYSGAARYIKEKKPCVQGILADPVGSTMGGGESGAYDIDGIGNDFIADTMDMQLVDRVIKITEQEAFESARALASREGIFAGPSSGAALAAVRKLIESGGRGTIVTIFPDRGDRYFSKGLYD